MNRKFGGWDRAGRLALCGALATGALVVAAPMAQGITYGELDEGRHPNVGALLWEYDALNPGPDPACSGTLIRNDSHAVFLTAAHCDPDFEREGDPVDVSFDRDVKPVTPETTLYRGRFYGHPGLTQPEPDPHDIAVVVFDFPIPGITAVPLPTAAQLDQMRPPEEWAVVGYGATETQQLTTFVNGQRRNAASGFLSLDPVFLNLSQSPLRREGGTCVVDSGGPVFPGEGRKESSTVVAITYGGDFLCTERGEYYRLDTPSARDFLDDYVTLP